MPVLFEWNRIPIWCLPDWGKQTHHHIICSFLLCWGRVREISESMSVHIGHGQIETPLLFSHKWLPACPSLWWLQITTSHWGFESSSVLVSSALLWGWNDSVHLCCRITVWNMFVTLASSSKEAFVDSKWNRKYLIHLNHPENFKSLYLSSTGQEHQWFECSIFIISMAVTWSEKCPYPNG